MRKQAHWEEVASARSSLLQRSDQVLSSQTGALHAVLPVLWCQLPRSSAAPQYHPHANLSDLGVRRDTGSVRINNTDCSNKNSQISTLNHTGDFSLPSQFNAGQVRWGDLLYAVTWWPKVLSSSELATLQGFRVSSQILCILPVNKGKLSTWALRLKRF